MEYITNANNARIVLKIADAIHDNEAYLSELDGAAGDGDHGVNMNKGFTMAKENISENMSFSDALNILRKILMEEIGGSMGPIYGTMFTKIFRTIRKEEMITPEIFSLALDNATIGLMDLGGAKVGDKTLLDTLYPAKESFKKMLENGESFKNCLDALIIAAEDGKESTKNMVAKVGRAARLGERSKGHIDAGAASCCLILKNMAEAMEEVLVSE